MSGPPQRITGAASSTWQTMNSKPSSKSETMADCAGPFPNVQVLGNGNLLVVATNSPGEVQEFFRISKTSGKLAALRL
jgi:hypothetical protein